MELVELLDQALAQTTFLGEDRTVLSTEELRQALSESHWGTSDRKQALSTLTRVSDAVLEPLASALLQWLETYFDAASGRLGHSFKVANDEGGRIRVTPDHAVEHQSKSHWRGFARALTRAAAVVGSESAAELLDGWANGEPLRFKICLVLAGLYVAEPLELEAGLRVYPLPISSEGLPLSMPDADSNRVQEMLGNPVLEIDAQTSPVFFKPPSDEGTYLPQETVTALQDVTVVRFLTALSLVSNRRVGVAWSWNDYGDAAAFATGSPSGWGGPGHVKLPRLGRAWTYHIETNITEITDFRPPSPNLDADGFSRAWKLAEELYRRMDASARFRIAVSRWEQSATRGAAQEDRAVDLRIALESLYLDTSDGEMGFRLSTTCARHLGITLEERRDISKTLKDFYGLASRVIHGTELSKTRDADAQTLRRASKLCRDGILKIVETKHQPKWSDLLLG